jgi:hypothetical protein
MLNFYPEILDDEIELDIVPLESVDLGSTGILYDSVHPDNVHALENDRETVSRLPYTV